MPILSCHRGSLRREKWVGVAGEGKEGAVEILLWGDPRQQRPQQRWQQKQWWQGRKDTTTNLWSDSFLAGRGGILTAMTTATTATKLNGCWRLCMYGWWRCGNIRKWCRIQKSTRFCQHRWGGINSTNPATKVPSTKLPAIPCCWLLVWRVLAETSPAGMGALGQQWAMVGQQQKGRRRGQGCLHVALHNTKEVRAAKKTA